MQVTVGTAFGEKKRHLNLAARDTKNFSDNKVKVCGKKF
jgi:hypothetical protein